MYCMSEEKISLTKEELEEYVQRRESRVNLGITAIAITGSFLSMVFLIILTSMSFRSSYQDASGKTQTIRWNPVSLPKLLGAVGTFSAVTIFLSKINNLSAEKAAQVLINYMPTLSGTLNVSNTEFNKMVESVNKVDEEVSEETKD